MAHNETFDMAGPAGRLEAILMHPDGTPRAAGIVCHAHPRHGGIMHYKVVFRAAKALQHHGLAVLRFNFRGVGRSEGAYDEGRGEQDDARAAVDEMQRRHPGLPVVLGGFSFGSVMGLRVGAADLRVRALFGLGFPIPIGGDGGFLRECRKPKLFVQGERDAFRSGAQLAELVALLPEPKSLVIVPESDHFFSGHLDALQAAIGAWAARQPWLDQATSPASLPGAASQG